MVDGGEKAELDSPSFLVANGFHPPSSTSGSMRFSLASLSKSSARALGTCEYIHSPTELCLSTGHLVQPNRAHHLLAPSFLPALGLSPSTASPRRQTFSLHQQLTRLLAASKNKKFINQTEARRILFECKARMDGGATDLLSREMFRAVNGNSALLL